jgi:hypothetical protein
MAEEFPPMVTIFNGGGTGAAEGAWARPESLPKNKINIGKAYWVRKKKVCMKGLRF